MRQGRHLIFVFSSDRENLSGSRDYSQKTGDGKSPVCSLFSLISSPVGIKKSWKRFVQDLPVPARFLHRDEYEEEFGELLLPLPAVFLFSQKTRSLFISAEELGTAGTLEDLMALVSQKLADIRSSQNW